MNSIVGNIINSKKAPLFPKNGKKKEMEGGKLQKVDKTRATRRRPARERKLALLEDVDNLKKKLRHEENVHRALERAFNRPLGALPRLPPYLPQYTQELLAEVAVLEEEVVRLEEQVVNFRQGLYEETVTLSTKKNADDLRFTSGKRHSRSLSQSEANLGSIFARPVPRLSRSSTTRKSNGLTDIASSSSEITNGKPLRNVPALNLENRFIKENGSSPDKKPMFVGTPLKRQQKTDSINSVNSLKMQNRIVKQAQESSTSSSDDHMESEANKTSEEILKCLISTFVRLSSPRGKTMDMESFSSLDTSEFGETNLESDFRDPYFTSSEFKKRDIGAYKHFYAVEASSFDPNRKTNASFFIRRLKILLDKLASVQLDSLNHHQKLAFWINVYNSCIMNAFLEHGIPESPDMIVALAQKAVINVGGFDLTGIMIEYFILRLPYHLKHTSKAWKNEEMKVFKAFGLEWSEPLVTFALSCGSWSSPAVRVYTASQIETELETAKRDYLQATVGISSLTNKLIVPKLLDWYLLDFAKDLDALLDWDCLQIPSDQLRNQAVKCLEAKGKEPLSELVQFMPYNFTFRYLIYMPQMKINTCIQ